MISNLILSLSRFALLEFSVLTYCVNYGNLRLDCFYNVILKIIRVFALWNGQEVKWQ